MHKYTHFSLHNANIKEKMSPLSKDYITTLDLKHIQRKREYLFSLFSMKKQNRQHSTLVRGRAGTKIWVSSEIFYYNQAEFIYFYFLKPLILNIIKLLLLVLKSCPTACNPMDCSLPGSSVRDFPGETTEVGCHFLLQGIFLTPGSYPCLLL